MSADRRGTTPSRAFSREVGDRDSESTGCTSWSPLEEIVKQASRSLELPPRRNPDMNLDLPASTGDRFQPKATATPAARDLDLDLDLNPPKLPGADLVDSVSLPRFLLQTR